jgi:hypothetical protein
VLAPSTGRARWTDSTQVLHSSAYTLREGGFLLGLLSPLQYGIVDRVTITTHPVLHLLLAPNVGLRIKVLDRYVALAVSGSWQQNLLYARNRRHPGGAHAAVTLSAPIGWRAVLSASAGYAPVLSLETGESPSLDVDRHRVLFSFAVNLLATHNDLIILQAHGMIRLAPDEMARPVLVVMYGHAFGSIRLGGGVSLGRFAITYKHDPSYEDSFRTNIAGWPIYPFVDLWWRF